MVGSVSFRNRVAIKELSFWNSGDKRREANVPINLPLSLSYSIAVSTNPLTVLVRASGQLATYPVNV